MAKATYKSSAVGASALTRYLLCKTKGAAVVSAAKTDVCFGIIQDGADANAPHATFCTGGTTKAIASAAIADGALLMPAAGGKVVTYDAAATSVKIGVANQAAGADGDEFEIELFDDKSQVA